MGAKQIIAFKWAFEDFATLHQKQICVLFLASDLSLTTLEFAREQILRIFRAHLIHIGSDSHQADAVRPSTTHSFHIANTISVRMHQASV